MGKRVFDLVGNDKNLVIKTVGKLNEFFKIGEVA